MVNWLKQRWLLIAVFGTVLVMMVTMVHWRYDTASHRFVRDRTLVAFSGDEPAYLGAINSLLFDHDLELGPDYRRARLGGLEFGACHVKEALDHHAIVVDRTTAERDLWIHIYDFDVRQSCVGCTGFARRTARFPSEHDLIEVPSHPVAFPIVIAAAIAPFRPSIKTSERYAGYAIVVVSWLTVLLTYVLGRRLFRRRGPALAAAALLLCTPWLAYSRSYFSEPLAGLVLVAATLTALRRRWVATGAALALAAAIKPAFALAAVAFVLDRVLRRRWRDAMLLSAAVGAGGLALGAFNFYLAGTPMIVGAGGAPSLGGLKPLYDTLFDREHGLICFVPWVPFAAIALLAARSLRPIAFAIGATFVVLALSDMGPSFCVGPRYWVPVLPWLSIAAVHFMLRAPRVQRIVAGTAMALGAVIAFSGALLYTESFAQAANRWW
jgi:hypothetical protein